MAASNRIQLKVQAGNIKVNKKGFEILSRKHGGLLVATFKLLKVPKTDKS